jgi:hypothetical protein
MINYKQLWLLVQHQLPDYLRHDQNYDKLVAFLEAYFAFLQEQGTNAPAEIISNMALNRSIDTSIDQFVDHFAREYLENFPIIFDKDNPTDAKRQQITRVVKHANEIYTAKSVEDAYRALFRILYDEEISFFYPKTVILKPSDGKWELPITVKIFNLTGDDIDALDLTYGSATAFDLTPNDEETGAKATVEGIIATSTILGLTYELFLTPDSIVKPNRLYAESPTGSPYAFKPGNTVKLQFGELVIYGEVAPVASLITVNDTVEGHTVGESLYAGDGINPVNTTVLLAVKSVDSNGRIKAINVSNSGVNITSAQNLVLDGNGNTVGTVMRGGLTYYPGSYVDIDGFLSDQIKLRGPLPNKAYPSGHIPQEYYQEFSYVIRTAVAISEWGDIVKKILHPIGYEVFGDVMIQPSIENGGRSLLGMWTFNTNDVDDPDTVHGGYLYHVLTLMIYHWVIINTGGWATSDVEISMTYMLNPVPVNKMGPTLESINKFKFVLPPYSGGDQYYGAEVSASNVSMLGSSSGPVPAWDSGAVSNSQLIHFKNLRVGDFFGGRAKVIKSNFCPEPYVIITP